MSLSFFKVFQPKFTSACSAVSAVILVLGFTACSFPRIIILKDPLTPEEHINLGVAYEKQGEIENATKEYKLAAKNLPLAYLYLGNLYFQQKDLDQAEKAYRRVLAKQPENADAANNLAWLYYTQGKELDKAEALARKALELNPAKEAVYRDTLEKILEARRRRP